MKKLFTLIAALVMFAGVAMADNVTVQFKASGVQSTYVDTTLSGDTVRGYYMLLESVDGTYAFYFLINDIQDMVDGTTYTLTDLNDDYSYGVDYDLQDYMFYNAVSLTRTDGVYTGTFSATGYYDSSNSRTYTLQQLQPINNPIDTVVINTTDRAYGRFTDAIDYYGLIQLIGADADYVMYLAFDADATTGTFTEDNINTSYTGLWNLSDDSSIALNNLLGDVTVTMNDGIYNATINWVGTDSVLYQIYYVYSDPTAITQETISGNLTVEENENYETYVYYGYYVYDVAVAGTSYTMEGTIYNTESNDVYGTWDVEDGDIELAFVDNTTSVEYDAFNGSITITGTATTGTSLAYGDIEFTINAGGTAVENAEVSEYNAYTEGNTIVLNGAEGQNAAIYDVAGRLISNGMVTSDNARFEVAASGVYMVRVNGQTLRVVVK